LNGTYAFSMSGTDNTQGLSISRIGSFHADGQGNITMAIEDVNDGGSFSTFAFTAAPASNYTMASKWERGADLKSSRRHHSTVADNFTFTIVLDSTSGRLDDRNRRLLHHEWNLPATEHSTAPSRRPMHLMFPAWTWETQPPRRSSANSPPTVLAESPAVRWT